MNVAGLFVTMLNITSYEDHGIPIKDISVKVAEVGNMRNELINENKFNLEDFRETGYYRRGDVGRYLSQSCRDYFYYGNVSSTDEGLCVSFFFADSPRSSPCKSEQNYQSYGSDHSDAQADYFNARRTKRDGSMDRK